MPKYGDIIKQAKSGKPDDQIDGLPESQTTRKQNSQKKSRRSASRASQPDKTVTLKPEDQITSKPDEPMKNLCVKVPESWRRYWAAQAKLTGRTMTDVMVEALKQEFGLPENQKTR